MCVHSKEYTHCIIKIKVVHPHITNNKNVCCKVQSDLHMKTDEKHCVNKLSDMKKKTEKAVILELY